jgi:hypothetical protein
MSQRIVGNAVRVSLVALVLLASLTPRARAQGAIRAVGTIGLGQQASGVLTQADQRYDGKPYQAYNFACAVGQSFQMNITSSWDNYALVFDPMGNVAARDDDSGGNLNARINYTCPVTGTYRLAVTAFSANTTGGPYTMQVAPAAPAVAPQVTPMGQPMTGATGVVGTIGLGQQASGVLSAGDARYDGKPFQAYNFACAAGQAFQMNITSTWDNYALVFDPMGNVVARDDDSGGSLNARINYTCPTTGTYRLAVTAFSASTTGGPYTMQVAQAVAAVAVAPQVTPMGQPMAGNLGVVGTIGVGQQASGVLSIADARFEGKPFQAYNFACSAGQSFQMDVTSTWDNYARVFDPIGNEVAHDDDSGGSLNARINYTCLTTGTYRLAVTAFSTSSTGGPYTLLVSPMAGPTQPTIQQAQPMIQAVPGAAMQPSVSGAVAAPGQMATIAYGQMAQGRLETGDQTMQDQTFADVWTFQGTAGQAITIDVMSDEFDAYAQLLDAAGNRLAEDDDAGGNLNARISFTLPSTGQFQIVVNNFGDSRRTGLYRIWLH